VRRLNRRVLEWSGHRSFVELLGRTIRDVARGEPWASMMAVLESSGREVLPENEVRDPEHGTSWRLAWSDFPPSEGEVPWTVFVIRDVTETVRLRDDLQRQETLAEVGSLVAGVAHEVRTPLFSISATLDAFEGEMPSEHDEAVMLLRAQVKRLSNLMSDLLDYGRPPVLQLERAGIEDVVRRAAVLCTPLAAETGVTVRTDFAGHPTAVDRDARRLEQAFQNLIANAIQHAPRGSEVVVTVRGARRGSGRYVDCIVTDQGPGITAEALPRLFEPFFTRRHGGTGLGLPIVQRIVEAHGGTVTAVNRPSTGAAFTISLPAAPAEVRPEEPLSA
jgi:signal transduction histidine kinase